MTKPRTKYSKFRKYTDDQLWTWYNFNLDKESRTIYFGAWNDSETGMGMEDSRDPWTVNDYSIQNLIKGLHILEKEGNEQIIINWVSHGGDWDAGMAVYDYMLTCRSYITMRCFGRVRSMGTIILQAADERILSNNCSFMIHYGTFALPEMHSKDALAEAEVEKDCNEIMENIYLERIREKKARYSRERLRDLMKFNKYMKPSEAVELGLADEVI